MLIHTRGLGIKEARGIGKEMISKEAVITRCLNGLSINVTTKEEGKMRTAPCADSSELP
jgi:hypothetical protein